MSLVLAEFVNVFGKLKGLLASDQIERLNQAKETHSSQVCRRIIALCAGQIKKCVLETRGPKIQPVLLGLQCTVLCWCGQSLLLFLFEPTAGCMFVLKLSDQLVFNPINWFSICSDSFKTNMHPAASSNKNNNKDCPHRPTAKKHCAP